MSERFDERYLRGIQLFNERRFYECHDVWEELWMEKTDEAKKFYQGLIQSAVALYHFSRDNRTGARTLYYSSLKYLEPYRPSYLNLNLDGFLAQMERCLHRLLEEKDAAQLDATLIPTIVLESSEKSV